MGTPAALSRATRSSFHSYSLQTVGDTIALARPETNAWLGLRQVVGGEIAT